ncbi:MAG: cysteine hydrolase [Clostridia bacterium]|nr:cysteine hydrolase [Clostridia bacterium]
MKKALIVIDMQNDFIDGALANPMAQAIIPNLISYMGAFNGDIFATRDTHGRDYLNSAEGKRLPVVHCVHGTHGWEIHPEIQRLLTEKNAKTIDKPTFGYLDWQILQDYDEIELVGTCTDICVVSNALILKATYPNANVKVRADLCAGTTTENHEAALAVMRCCQVEIV